MAFGSLDPTLFPPDNRMYGKNNWFAIASAEHASGARLRTCSRGMRRSISGLQHSTPATSDWGAGGIAFDVKFWVRRGRQQFFADGHSLGFDRRRDSFIRRLERFRIFRKRRYFSDERGGRSKRAVHGDFYSTRRREFSGQHFFCEQRFGLVVKAGVQRHRDADDQHAQRLAHVEPKHLYGGGI